MSRTPWASTGIIRPPRTTGGRRAPNSSGIEGPHTSASRIPTVDPAAASATARLAVTVDLPTPPLPLATA